MTCWASNIQAYNWRGLAGLVDCSLTRGTSLRNAFSKTDRFARLWVVLFACAGVIFSPVYAQNADSLAALKPKIAEQDSAAPSANPPVRVSDSTAIKAITLPVISDSLKDSVKVVASDSQPKVKAIAPDSVPRAKRKRIVRETTVNTLNELKGRYRSPKRALFLSLVIPGLGQAYVGNSAFNYARAVAYFAIDMSLGYAWYHYVSVRHDQQVRKYRIYADSNWSVSRYEDSLSSHFPTGTTPGTFQETNMSRELYCFTLINPNGSVAQENLFRGCDEYDSATTSGSLANFRELYKDEGLSTQEIGSQRAKFADPFSFYEIIGKEQEFIVGWKDVNNVVYTKDRLNANSEMRDTYVSMRQKAEEYSKLQAYFIGGMVVNHIVSAIDAALAARYHNLDLYETETTWIDKIRLDSRISYAGNDLQSWVGAFVSF
jgi:hypothetical protein